jgi:hypothetical protein
MAPSVSWSQMIFSRLFLDARIKFDVTVADEQ